VAIRGFRVARQALVLAYRQAFLMSKSEDYRRFARACLEIADVTEDQQIRAVFIQMAQVWFRMAEEHAKAKDSEIAD
jgi:hypothetical protein